MCSASDGAVTAVGLGNLLLKPRSPPRNSKIKAFLSLAASTTSHGARAFQDAKLECKT